MKFNSTPLNGSYLIDLKILQDDRGKFARIFCKEQFKEIGHTKEFVQFNHSINTQKGTLRGMHFQSPPYTEVKLIRCIVGSVYDVIVDLRMSSPTFLQWFGAELSADNMRMMYVPEGFAHGFITLTDNAQLLYHHTEFYTPESDSGIRYDDPELKIEWPRPVEKISAKDLSYHLLSQNFKGIDLTKQII